MERRSEVKPMKGKAKLISVSLTECELISIQKKIEVMSSMYAEIINHPCHVTGYQPQPYFFALNHIFVCGITPIIHYDLKNLRGERLPTKWREVRIDLMNTMVRETVVKKAKT